MDVGIDVAAAELVVAVHQTGERWAVTNDAAGHAALVRRLAGLSPTRVVLEATGGLERPAALALAAAGLPVRVLNPRQSRDFARATGRLAKTDRLDAAALAHLAAALGPDPRPLPDAAAHALRALFTRRTQLLGLLVAERHRRRTADPAVHPSIAAVIAMLTAQVTAVEDEVARRIAADPAWRATAAILRSVPGIGPVAALAVLAALPEVGTLTRQQIAALVGVAPFDHASGTSAGHARIAGGRAGVRTTLSRAALTAARCNPVIRTFDRRLRAAHKPPKLALIACVRKLLTLLHAMVRDGTTRHPAGAP